MHHPCPRAGEALQANIYVIYSTLTNDAGKTLDFQTFPKLKNTFFELKMIYRIIKMENNNSVVK